MILKNSYSSYFKNTFKRKSWILVLSSLLFFLTLTLPVLMQIGKQSEVSYTGIDPNDAAIMFSEFCQSLTKLMDYRGVPIKITFIFLAVVAGVSAFSYLHNRSKVDFYHSFPISRKTAFTCNFLGSTLPVLMGFFLNFILTHILIASFGYGQALMSVEIWKALAENILFFTATFSIVALSTILCGNTVITLILASVALFGQVATALLISSLKYFLYPFYLFDADWVLKLSPVTQIFNSYDFVNQNRLLMFICYFLVTGLIVAFSLFCFKKRKSENAGTAIAFQKLKLPLKIYCCIIFGLGFGILFTQFVNQELWVYFGVIFGILLAHALSEITFDFNFHSILKNWRHSALLVVLSCSVVLCMGLDVTGFNTRTVSVENVKGFGFLAYTNGNSSREYQVFNQRSLKSAENIKAITEIIEIASAPATPNTGAFRFDVAVDTAPFGVFKRRYFLEYTDKNMELLNSIRYSEEYKRASGALFSKDIQSSTNLSLTKGKGTSYEIKLFSGEKVKNIVLAMQEDALNLTVEEGSNKPPLFIADFSFEVNRRSAYIQSLPIYASYVKTLALLKEYWGITPELIDVNTIEKVEISNDVLDWAMKSFNKESEDNKQISHPKETTTQVSNEKENVMTFTDKADIELLLKNAAFQAAVNDADYGYTEAMVSMRVYFEGESEPLVYETIAQDVYDVYMAIK